jgi:diacylglycerol kinase
MLRNKMATLLTIVVAMLISAGMTWQQRLLFVGGIAFGVAVEALPSLVDDLKDRLAEWRRLRQFTTRAKAA